MHATVGPSGTVYHHNGDFSGDVVFNPPSPEGILPLEAVSVPFADMLELVGAWYKDKKISALEQMSGTEFLDSVNII